MRGAVWDCVVGHALSIRDDSAAHGLGVVLISGIRRHGHCPLVRSFWHNSSLGCGSRRVILLLAKCVRGRDVVVTARAVLLHLRA
jgi:hypothetical protein